jgi:hydrogenase expression/formation protein HypC
MCLAIPGRIETIDREQPDLAEVEVAGLTRRINIGILERRPAPNEWVLIQSGFAVEIIDAETARIQIELLNEYTGASTITEQPDFDWETMTVAEAKVRGEDE